MKIKETPRVMKTPFSSISPIDYISPPPNLSKMNSSSKLLFCDESALKSCSSILSANFEENECNFERTETNFKGRFNDFITPQQGFKSKKPNWLSSKNSIPFTPNQQKLDFSSFQKPISSQPFFTPQPKPVGVIMSKERKDDLKKFDINEETISEDGRTSLMIKNIPNKYTKEMIVEILDIAFYERYDFFYLPLDFKVVLRFLTLESLQCGICFYQLFVNKRCANVL